MDRMENIVTEEDDRKEEEQRIRSALKECGYPKWAMDRVKQQITDRPQKPTATKKDNSNKSRVWWSFRTWKACQRKSNAFISSITSTRP